MWASGLRAQGLGFRTSGSQDQGFRVWFLEAECEVFEAVILPPRGASLGFKGFGIWGSMG